MKIGSLFAGIGGLEMGLEQSGLGHTVWQVEQDAFALKVLAKHWPSAERYTDVKEVGAHNLAPVDVLCGGFPCQDVSSAGKGEGLSGSRSGLWFEFARVIEELHPEWVIVENVASGAKRWVDQVTAHLGKLGYETLPIPISAKDVGAPHLRRRIFLVAHSDKARLEKRQSHEQARAEMEPPATERVGGGRNAAHTKREQLRKQSRRSGGQDRQGTPQPTEHGQNGSTANTNGNRQPIEPKHGQAPWVQEFTEDGRWQWRAPVAPVCGSDAIVPDRTHRLKCLGNAVVPACAEVIGHIIQELTKGRV